MIQHRYRNWGARGPWPHRFYNFSIGIGFLLYKLILSIKPPWPPSHEYLPTLLNAWSDVNNTGCGL